MNRRQHARNAFFCAFVRFALFALVIFNVAAEFYAHFPEAYFVDFNEERAPRVMAARADALAAVAMRAAQEVAMGPDAPARGARRAPRVAVRPSGPRLS